MTRTTIHKYSLTGGLVSTLLMPAGYRVIHVDWDTRELRLVSVWAEVPAAAPLSVSVTFVMVPTGGEVPNGTYIGSLQRDGTIFHIYETDSATKAGCGDPS